MANPPRPFLAGADCEFFEGFGETSIILIVLLTESLTSVPSWDGKDTFMHG